MYVVARMYFFCMRLDPVCTHRRQPTWTFGSAWRCSMRAPQLYSSFSICYGASNRYTCILVSFSCYFTHARSIDVASFR